MAQLTLKDLEKLPPDDWRALYLNQGQELLALAKNGLAATDAAQLGLALKIVHGALFEEDLENPNAAPSLRHLDFSPLVAPLSALLADTAHGPSALYALWVCCYEGASVSAVAHAAVEKWLDKAVGKVKVNRVSARALAFRVLIHGSAQNKQLSACLPYLKGNADLAKVLFEEIATYPCARYDLSAALEWVIRNLQAKGESTVNQAVTALWTMVKGGVDITPATAYLFDNQKRLRMFSDAPAVLAGFYLKHNRYADLLAWLQHSDPEFPVNAYRGILGAWRAGISGQGFYLQARVQPVLDQIGQTHRLTSLASFVE